ncbi:BON domain-containing protein [Allocoleopsis franciscana]|uniref:Putative periplasmic or secreted lipoprotein n=1 Tax=Allocoleopsis franciscana PCC 7113 TaxID=1173027 RepID=K9WM75_9CYAN|nr:BON domain-containing protein [Allocoleopsis franciscana]AFZ20617.1 putative periplasmic or secreted lipoprotein [Allocoleopsis franciscana PCC 7113]
MKKLTTLLLTSILGLSVAACENVARTNPTAPRSVNTVGEAPGLDKVLRNTSDSTSPIRRAQANSDIRAREQRYNTFRQGDGERSDQNLQSEVRSKLEVNIPRSQLTVQANEGVITVVGYVQTQQELEKIEPLAREIRGVRDVNVQAKIGPKLPPYES